MNGQLSLSRPFAALAAGVLALAISMVGVAGSASAHSGPIELDFGHDGAGYLVVTGSYINDGHQVEDIMDPVVTAVSSTGEEVGPLVMQSGIHGPTAWSTTEKLPEGQWEVTVNVTTPDRVTLTTPIEIVYVAEETTDSAIPTATLLTVGIAVAVLVLATLGVLIVLRFRTKKS